VGTRKLLITRKQGRLPDTSGVRAKVQERIKLGGKKGWLGGLTVKKPHIMSKKKKAYEIVRGDPRTFVVGKFFQKGVF